MIDDARIVVHTPVVGNDNLLNFAHGLLVGTNFGVVQEWYPTATLGFLFQTFPDEPEMPYAGGELYNRSSY